MLGLGLKQRLEISVLGALVRAWPSPVKMRETWGEVSSQAYDLVYARKQYAQRQRFGLGLGDFSLELKGQRVLEIGCGRGGIACYLASQGASVVGVDVSHEALTTATELRDELVREGVALDVSFEPMDAHRLPFAEEFDCIIADNVFEHVESPQELLQQCSQALKPQGLLCVPTFSSIRSKWGLHLKHGIKMPWANLLFSEEAIVKVLRKRAQRAPSLFKIYPGLTNKHADRVRDVRAHKDLNEITYQAFLHLAHQIGFEVLQFDVYRTRAGQITHRALPKSWMQPLDEILSTGARAVLRKP